MKESLAIIAEFFIGLTLLAALILPFMNTWFFLLSIAVIPVLPHLDKIQAKINDFKPSPNEVHSH